MSNPFHASVGVSPPVLVDVALDGEGAGDDIIRVLALADVAEGLAEGLFLAHGDPRVLGVRRRRGPGPV